MEKITRSWITATYASRLPRMTNVPRVACRTHWERRRSCAPCETMRARVWRHGFPTSWSLGKIRRALLSRQARSCSYRQPTKSYSFPASHPYGQKRRGITRTHSSKIASSPFPGPACPAPRGDRTSVLDQNGEMTDGRQEVVNQNQSRPLILS